MQEYIARILKLHGWDTDSKAIPSKVITTCADTVAPAALLSTDKINHMKIENRATIVESEIPSTKLNLPDPPNLETSKLLHDSTNIQDFDKHNSKINIQFLSL